ncbi:MAG: hypothetical protein OEY92_01460 [Elusimicrobiota bacterium]|nr:hypothetical protein [Elusimicrobiota bacterium]
MKKIDFYKGISILFIACFSLIIFAEEISAEKGFLDIGLRVYNGTEIVYIAAEPAGTLTSSLRIAKNGVIYGIVLVDPGDANDSGLRIQTSSGIKALRKYVPLPTAYVSINMWSKRAFLMWDVVYVMVTVRENTSSGLPISGVVVRGTWSGGYGGTVSGTTNASGVAGTWTTDPVANTWVYFTVNKITTGSNEYNLGGTLSSAIKISN